jgi:hypothetical protein
MLNSMAFSVEFNGDNIEPHRSPGASVPLQENLRGFNQVRFLVSIDPLRGITESVGARSLHLDEYQEVIFFGYDIEFGSPDAQISMDYLKSVPAEIPDGDILAGGSRSPPVSIPFIESV